MQKGQKSITDSHKSLYADLNVVHDVASLTKKVHPQIRTSLYAIERRGILEVPAGWKTLWALERQVAVTLR